MNTSDNVINQLAIELASKTVNAAYDKAELDEALAELQQVKDERDEALGNLGNIKSSFEKINEILQSDERLKNLYEEVKAKQIEKG
nr:MAG TPA: tumor suppressor protein [Caudoviricetes sp.]